MSREQDRIIEALREEVLVLKAKNEMLQEMVLRGAGQPASEPDPNEPSPTILKAFVSMTPKMHGTMQMLLRGAKTREVAERFGIAEGTAKVFVASVLRKFDLHDRHDIVYVVSPTMKDMTDAAYESVATIPKDWDVTWKMADRKKRPELYRKTR